MDWEKGRRATTSSRMVAAGAGSAAVACSSAVSTSAPADSSLSLWSAFCWGKTRSRFSHSWAEEARRPCSRCPTSAPISNRRKLTSSISSCHDPGQHGRCVGSHISRAADRPLRPTETALFNGRVRRPAARQQRRWGRSTVPATSKVYIDLELLPGAGARAFSAPGDFAQAYVIAHEVGHHVQNLLGIMRQVDTARRSGGRWRGANGCRCARAAGGLLRRRVGATDRRRRWHMARAGRRRDRAERRGRGRRRHAAEAVAAAPSSPSRSRTAHPPSAQRWFKTGFESGDVKSCDTFGAPSP